MVAVIGEWDFVLYRGVALSQGLICSKRVHLGLSKAAFIEGVSSHQGWPSGVAFTRVSTVVQSVVYFNCQLEVLIYCTLHN